MLGDRIAGKSGVPAVVKTADGEEVLVRDAWEAVEERL
jgi:hypothetical protein